MADVQQRIVTGRAAVLRPLLDILEAHPETAVVSVHLNRQAEPDRLVVAMAPARADALHIALSPLIELFHDDALLGPEPHLPDPDVPLPGQFGQPPDPEPPPPEEVP